jgi:hypothetical protein
MTQELVLRSQSFYTGRMYDDDSNLREVGWRWVHDVSLDFDSLSQKFKAGLSVRNITNVVSSTVTDKATNHEGRQTLRGFWGETQSGRSWVASISHEL